MIMTSEGQKCGDVRDCDPRLCRLNSHILCKNHRCECAYGALNGVHCSTAGDCDPKSCPPSAHAVCETGVCWCITN